MAKKKVTGGVPSNSDFIGAVFKFFSAVKTDTVLSVLWGVEVLLFSILLLMVFFGNLTADQRFYLALIIIASVVATFLTTAWRMHQKIDPAPSQQPPGVDASAQQGIIAQARKCLDLLTEIRDANARIIRRSDRESEPWAQFLNDTYNNICRTCYERRRHSPPPDAYLDVVCADADVKSVCDSKWQLGEALEDYRVRLNRLSWPPEAHDDLERLIRRSITQPDLSPRDLEPAAGHAIDVAKRVLANRKG